MLKPGGRFLCLATNWDSAFWHGPDVTLTAEIGAAWDGHAAWPNLPARLPPMLARTGFANIRTLPVPVVNPNLHENAFAYWAARLMAAYAVGKGVAEARAQAWLAALDAAEEEGVITSYSIHYTKLYEEQIGNLIQSDCLNFKATKLVSFYRFEL